MLKKEYFADFTFSLLIIGYFVGLSFGWSLAIAVTFRVAFLIYHWKSV